MLLTPSSMDVGTDRSTIQTTGEIGLERISFLAACNSNGTLGNLQVAELRLGTSRWVWWSLVNVKPWRVTDYRLAQTLITLSRKIFTIVQGLSRVLRRIGGTRVYMETGSLLPCGTIWWYPWPCARACLFPRPKAWSLKTDFHNINAIELDLEPQQITHQVCWKPGARWGATSHQFFYGSNAYPVQLNPVLNPLFLYDAPTWFLRGLVVDEFRRLKYDAQMRLAEVEWVFYEALVVDTLVLTRTFAALPSLWLQNDISIESGAPQWMWLPTPKSTSLQKPLYVSPWRIHRHQGQKSLESDISSNPLRMEGIFKISR